MKTTLRIVMVVLSVAGVVFASNACASSGNDAAAVRAVALQQADAWNNHDAVAYSALFTPNCDVVNIVGWWWKGRTELRQKLSRAFAFVLAHSTLAFTDVQVRFLAPDIAVAHARWKMTGAQPLPGMPPPEAGIQTLVLTKQGDGKWLIAVFQNTQSKPERPFPAGLPDRSQ